MAINKVVYGSNTLIDLTADTAVASDVVLGKTFHLADGSIGIGTFVFKRWLYSNDTELATSQNITLVTDQWLAENYDNPNLEIEVSRIESQPFSGSIYFTHAIARNKAFTTDTKYHQITTRIGNSKTYATVLTNVLQGTGQPTTRGQIRLLPSGALMTRVDSVNVLAVGDYEIIARLIP